MSQAGIINIADGNIPGNVPIIFQGNTGPGASAVNHIIDIVGEGGVTVDTTGQVITIRVTSSGFTWNLVTSISPPNPIQIIAENGYSCQGTNLVTFILPLAPNFGDTFIIASTTSRFQINQNGGQQMIVGSASTTAGSGYLISNTVGDFVEFVYVGSNIFQSFSPQGTLSLN
jgi:hypothetical protein